tara:strand:- start:2042 stop:10936 length:8895 start_codon:yes stop_codon:yes gene_type:complete
MDVTLPNGRVISGVPDGMTQDSLREIAIKNGLATAEDFASVQPAQPAGQPTAAQSEEFEGNYFLTGIGRGVDVLQEGYGSAIEGFGGVFDLPGVEQYGADVVAAQKKQLEETSAGALQTKDIKEKGLLSYISATLGAQVPQLGSTLGGAYLGGKVGGGIGAAFGGVGAIPGALIGSVVGGIAANLPFFYGSNREAQKQEIAKGNRVEVSESAAILAAGPQALLDYIADRFLIGGLTPKAIRQGGLFTRGIKGGTAGVVTEVPTEIGQQVLQRLQAGQDLTSDEAMDEYFEVAVAAGLVGGTVRGGTSIFQGRVEDDAPPPPKTEDELAADAAAVFNEDTEPLALPAPEETPLLPDFSNEGVPIVDPDVDIGSLVDGVVSNFSSDLPLSFNKGKVVVTDDVGTPASYEVASSSDGIFVVSKQGVRVSPNFSSTEQAAEFRDRLNVSVNEMMAVQDEVETQRQATEAVKRAKLEETGATLEAARATLSSPSIDFSSIPGDAAQAINVKRTQTGRSTLGAQDTVTLEELSDNNVSQEVIDGLLPSSEAATVEDVRSAAASKNILVEDAGFERFARRNTGSANIERMSPTQLGYMIDAIEGLPAIPGETAQALPVIQTPEFTGPQYSATISLAKRKGEEGVLKSEVSKNIDMKRGAPTQSLIQAGLDRGDLVPHPTKKNRWVSRQFYEERLNRPRTPLERGEQVEAEARAREEQAQPEMPARETLGPGIIVETTREEGDTRSIPERSREFQERLGETTPTPEALSRREEIQQSLTDELNRFAASPAGRAAKLDASKIGVEIVDSVTTGAGTRAEGQLLADADSGKVIIQLALDTAQEGAATDAQVKNNLRDVFNHEVVHALKALGVINEADMASLVKYSKNARIKGSKKTIYQEIVENYTEKNVGRQLSKEELEEEAVADAFRYWAAGQLKVTGKPKSIFDRIVRFFRSIGSGLSNAEITSAEQIFNNLRAPIGARSAPVAPANREAARQAEAAAAAEGMDVPDAPIDAYEGKYSLYPAQLDGLAQKIMGVETVREGNIVRRFRATDLPAAVKQRLRLNKEQKKALDRQKAAIDGKYSLARKPIDPKDPVFSSRDSKHDNAEVAGKALPPRGKARRLSVLDLLYNDNLLPRTGSSTGYVARLLQERSRKVLSGKPVAIESDTSKDGLLSDVFAAEAIAALEETGNAATWYSEKVTEAIEVASQLYPEIATDADARFAFLAALSVTSQNTPVMENSVYTSEVYEYFRENQRFPEDFSKGKHGKSMASNFALLNDLLDTMGPQGVRAFFDKQFTVKQLKDAGFKPPSGENVDTVVYGSFLLGPKIGQGFYQNLNGNFSPVTIDMWLMRTVGRATGRLIGKPEIVEKQADRLLKGLNADPEKSRNNFLIASIRDAQIDGDLDALVEVADELRLEHDRLFLTPEVQALFRQKKYNKPEWAKAAEAIITQQNKPQDAPSGGNFRNAVRRIMDKTRQKMADSGYDVTNADLQAILWYPEKNLYKKLGVRTKDNLNIDYAQAFERILEGRTELDAEGNVLQPVGRGVGTETADVTGRAEEDGLELDEITSGEGAGSDPGRPKFSLAPQRETPENTLLNFIKQNPEGFTVTIDGQPAPAGYVVAPVKAAEITVKADELNADSVREYAEILKDVADSTNRETYAGGWLNSEDGLYYLDAVHIYDELDTALYIADSAEQLAIFDLRTFDEVRTPEGIEQLKSAGTYSDQARNERGRDSDQAARKYAEIRADRGPKFSLSREQLTERDSFSRYNEQFSVPIDAYEASSLSRVTSPSPHSENGSHRILFGNKALTVFVPKGFDKFSRNRDKTFGFGQRHMVKHDVEASKRTGGTYNSIADLATAALNAYWPLRNNLGGSPFKVTEVQGATGSPQMRMEWKNESSGYPAVFIFEPFYVSTVMPGVAQKNPNLANTQVMYLKNGFVGASDGKSSSPVPQPAIRVKDRTREMEVSIQRGMANAVSAQESAKVEREVLTLKRKYSLKRSEDNLSPDARKIYQDRISTPEDQTFFQRIMSSFDMSDPSKRSVMLKIRRNIADNYAGARAMGKRAQEIADINAEAQVNSAIGQLERKRGVVAAGLNIGPLVRFGGQVTAINENIVENLENDQARAKFQAAFDRLQQETQYIETDPVTGEQTVVRYESTADLKGLAKIFEEIEQEGLWAGFNLYAAAKRANRLMTEGREKTFTQEEINLSLEEGAKNPAIVRAYRNYQLWNNAFVGVMENSGVISGEAAQLWKDNSDYLPFYRQAFENEGAIYDIPTAQETASGDVIFTPDGASPNNSVLQNVYNIKAPKELKGGKPFYFVMVNNVSDSKSYTNAEDAATRLNELRKMNPRAKVGLAKSNQRIDNPINNILRNFDAGVTSVLTNVVASRAVRDLQRLGLAQRIPTPNRVEPTPDVVGIRVNGETKYYRVQDELLLASLGATGDFQMPGLDLMAAPANLLRELITKDPGFMAANMLRDSVSAWTTSGVTKIPGPSTVAGFVKTIAKDASAEALEASGVVGGYDAKQDKEAVKLFKKINRQRGRGGLSPIAWWDKWDKLSLASDTATRVAVYNQILKDTGGNIAAANTEALDVINFSRKGSSHGIRFFSAVVPFLNARIQGLDVLYRSGARGDVGTTSSMTKAQRQRRFFMRALAIISMSTAYAMASMDDEDNEWYQNATEVDKDNYWIIPPTWLGLDTTPDTPALKIPIPFEVGVLFKVVPERIVRTVRDDTGMSGNWGAFQRHFMGTFAINPVPQFMLPIAETVANFDSFTGRPVVTYWDEKREPYLSNPDYVSPLAIETSKGISEKFNIRVPAENIDHLVRGYTGTLGSYALMAADGIMRSAAGMPDRPARRLDQYPVLSRFLQEGQGTGPVESFFDIYQEVMLFSSSVSEYENTGRLEELDKYIGQRQNVALEADYIKSLAESLKELRRFRKQVSTDPVMSADDKADYFKEIQTQMNEIVSEITKDKERIIRRTD